MKGTKNIENSQFLSLMIYFEINFRFEYLRGVLVIL